MSGSEGVTVKDFLKPDLIIKCPHRSSGQADKQNNKGKGKPQSDRVAVLFAGRPNKSVKCTRCKM